MLAASLVFELLHRARQGRKTPTAASTMARGMTIDKAIHERTKMSQSAFSRGDEAADRLRPFRAISAPVYATQRPSGVYAPNPIRISRGGTQADVERLALFSNPTRRDKKSTEKIDGPTPASLPDTGQHLENLVGNELCDQTIIGTTPASPISGRPGRGVENETENCPEIADTASALSSSFVSEQNSNIPAASANAANATNYTACGNHSGRMIDAATIGAR